jgi:hypothetical protein
MASTRHHPHEVEAILIKGGENLAKEISIGDLRGGIREVICETRHHELDEQAEALAFEPV